MKNEEAVNFFQNFIQTMALNGEKEVLNNKYCNASRVAISAIEKQIPKKVGEDGYGWYECSECHNKRPNWLLGKDAKWCPYCGQRIDWEEALYSLKGV